MSTHQPSSDADDLALLERVRQRPDYPSLRDLSARNLRETVAREGIDFATALLYDRVVRSTEHGPFIRAINALFAAPAENLTRLGATLVIVPGAFYVEYPRTGADGRMLREVADASCCPVEVLPTISVGRLADNAEIICNSLDRRGEGKIVLASLSKGSSEVKVALARPEADRIFRNVLAWMNVGGLLSGAPLAAHVLASRPRTLVYRAMFAIRGHDFRFVRDMAPGPDGPLAFELRPPAHMKMISIVGFPLTRHLSNRLTRRAHRRMAHLGPNDAGGLLLDACQAPGYVYPVWGADHYLRPRWDVKRLALALLRYLSDELVGAQVR